MKIVLKSKHSNLQKGGEKRMSHLRIILVLSAAVFVLATAAFIANTWAVENVRMTKHNLSANPDINMQGTTEVCLFCHTPHGGRTDVAGGAAPIWNRTLTNATGYKMYASPNFDAQGIGPKQGKPNGVSLACLSCHDGTVAFDSLINLPGSGGYQGVNGARPNPPYSATGPFVDQSTGTFNAAAAPFPNIGEPSGGVVDLSNDHPISMELPCATDPQFYEVCNNSDLSPLSGSPPKVAYLTRFGQSVLPADTRDRIRAYPTNLDGKPYIECASCHNPHEASRPTDDGSTATDYKNSRFLRRPSWDTTEAYYTSVDNKVKSLGATAGVLGDRNAGSLLCLSCHQK